jgi:L-amino acid N-acyltransferase YncA
MIEIRQMGPNDLMQVIEMGKTFFEESPFVSFAEWDEGSFQLTILSLLSGSTPGGLLVAEDDGKLVGMAAYVIFPLYFNLRTHLAQEVFWYCLPAHRKGLGSDLMDELERDAMKNGAKVFIGANMSGERDAAFARIYRRRGYMPGENTHIRILSS